MKERPILLSGPMVRALLDGSKTQTRRVCKPAATLSAVIAVQDPDQQPIGQRPPYLTPGWFGDEDGEVQFYCPYGEPGDRLWVREAHYLTDDGHSEFAVYAADDDAVREHLQRLEGLNADFPVDVKAAHKRLRPSIHMPRWASRLTLEIASVQVERLQAISEADAKAEGIKPDEVRQISLFGASADERAAMYRRAAVRPYRNLWESINGDGSWDANPWVWVIEFKRVTS